MDKIKLPITGPYTAKDQEKSDRANKFIGRGSPVSSTERYRNAWGNLGNCGNYTPQDVVFISAEGNRRGRKTPDLEELKKAIDAGATLVTDNQASRNRPYNLGEREVASFLQTNHYEEVKPGIWTPSIR